MGIHFLLFLGAELALGAAAILIVRFGLGLFTVVKGSSMRETLQNGDLLWTRRYGKKREIQRFDIVICRFSKRKGRFVKRVIALPGERIRMEEDVVYINDVALEENFPRRHCKMRMREISVPEGCYFLMGDNRASSNDSRRVGAIAQADILARAEAILLSFGRSSKL